MVEAPAGPEEEKRREEKRREEKTIRNKAIT
jgi:hypothetical protein